MGSDGSAIGMEPVIIAPPPLIAGEPSVRPANFISSQDSSSPESVDRRWLASALRRRRRMKYMLPSIESTNRKRMGMTMAAMIDLLWFAVEVDAIGDGIEEPLLLSDV